MRPFDSVRFDASNSICPVNAFRLLCLGRIDFYQSERVLSVLLQVAQMILFVTAMQQGFRGVAADFRAASARSAKPDVLDGLIADIRCVPNQSLFLRYWVGPPCCLCLKLTSETQAPSPVLHSNACHPCSRIACSACLWRLPLRVDAHGSAHRSRAALPDTAYGRLDKPPLRHPAQSVV